MEGRNPNFRDMARKKKVTIWKLKKDWKIRYDETWREIMEEVSEIVEIPYEDVERINSAWWKFVGEMMCRVEMPEIRMVYLCRIYPSKVKLYSYCEYMGRLISRLAHGRVKEDVKIGDLNVMRKHLGRLQDTYFRVQEECEAEKKSKMEAKNRRDLEGRKGRVIADIIELRQLKEAKNKTDDK